MTRCRQLGAAMILAAVCAPPATVSATDPPERRGLYAIWYQGKPDVLNLPFITGGQAIVQWADLHVAEGRYDFSKLEAILKDLHEARRPATVQVNGNVKPAWLFEKVPSCPEKLSVQVSDRRGTLMYWHPAHEKAYLDFLGAYADFLKKSPCRDIILGVRLNFNAIGTEHLVVSADRRDPSRWNCPPGSSPAPAWTRELAAAYQKAVVRAFVRHFPPEIRVFVRNNIDDRIRQEFREQFETGKLGWFHTSSEIEPRGNGRQYETFLDYCRTARTLAYAEPWASAWGHHGGQTDARWCSPPQWNYWRLLCDLNCGVSFIACYGVDLEVARSGRYMGKDVRRYRDEFFQAFAFAAKYAGFHASPKESPGAWVALREGKFLQGDYTFLARRLKDASREARNVGPEDQRYGAWARVLPAGDTLRIALDETFAESLNGAPAAVRVIYLDKGPGTLTVKAAGSERKEELKDTGRWQISTWSLSRAAFAKDAAGAHLAVAADRDVALHMVEVVREPRSGGGKAASQGEKQP